MNVVDKEGEEGEGGEKGSNEDKEGRERRKGIWQKLKEKEASSIKGAVKGGKSK